MLKQKNVLDDLKGLSLVLVTDDICACNISMRLVTRQVAEKYKITYVTVYAKDEVDFCKRYNIKTLPGVLLLNDNEIVAIVHGYQPEEILELYIEAKLEDFLNLREGNK